jgi:hypothetical protein
MTDHQGILLQRILDEVSELRTEVKGLRDGAVEARVERRIVLRVASGAGALASLLATAMYKLALFLISIKSTPGQP